MCATNVTQVPLSIGNMKESVLKVRGFMNLSKDTGGCGCLGISQGGKVNVLVVIIRQNWDEGAQRKSLV